VPREHWDLASAVRPDPPESDGDADGPAPRHPPGVHERDDDEGYGAGDRADTPRPAVPATKGPARLPGDLIDLADWYLTLPTGTPGDPDTVENPDLATFGNAFFTLNDARDGVVFSAHGDGVTTKNSHYPRSELREMNGREKAAWSNTRGRHTLNVCEAITQVPSAKPEVVAAQIHDDKDDVLQIRLEGQKLSVQYDDGTSEQVLDPAYQLVSSRKSCGWRRAWGVASRCDTPGAGLRDLRFAGVSAVARGRRMS
jgi:hypothetical protein